MENIDDFKIPKWSQLSTKTATFILNQAERLLVEHIETAKLLTTRAQTIIGWGLSLLIGLIAYIFEQTVAHKINGFEFWIPFFISVSIVAILVLAFDVYWIYKGRPL